MGVRPTLENSTACQKSMPIFVVGLRLWFIPFGGGGLVWLTAIFPLVDFEFKSSGLGSVSASISDPSGFVFPLPFWGGG